VRPVRSIRACSRRSSGSVIAIAGGATGQGAA
jgi:hypothetical protein